MNLTQSSIIHSITIFFVVVAAVLVLGQVQSRSVQSVMSDSLRPNGPQHVRLPCPSPSPGAWSNSCPSHLILCRPLLILPLIFPSIRIYSNDSALRIRWPKYQSFSFSINPSKECSGLISFRIDWFDLLAVQGTLKSLLQYHSSKASILQCSAFFYGPTLTSMHDYWKNQSFDQIDLLAK